MDSKLSVVYPIIGIYAFEEAVWTTPMQHSLEQLDVSQSIKFKVAHGNTLDQYAGNYKLNSQCCLLKKNKNKKSIEGRQLKMSSRGRDESIIKS